MDTKRKHRLIGRYLLFAWLLFLYIFAGYYALHIQNHPMFDNADWQVPRDFHSRLKRHGLDKEFSVIEISKGKLYFYRDGKKVNF